jgi:hypothetical protein
VSLRIPRPAMVPAAVGLAATCVLLGSSPTLADQVRNQQWWLRSLHVTQAWRTTQGSGVTVAVLDTGVDAAQPDLAGSVLAGPDDTGSGEAAASPFFASRGTAVASLIAGHGHGTGARSAGIMGVAPDAKILSVRVTLSSGDPLLANAHIAAKLPDAIAAGLRYAARQGAKVIDLPLDPGQAGAAGGPAVAAAAGGSAAERSAIEYALGQGAVVVAPAGDDGTAGNAINYPAAYPGVISVGAFNATFIKAPFSIRQDYVTLTAPGDGVIAATPTGYATMNSTSAASAMVAGIAALIRSQYPQLTPSQVTKALQNGTVFRPNGKTGVGSGFGTADAARALSAAATVAGSGTRRSGTGAAPRVAPAPPPVAPLRQSTASRLTTDGLISGAVLILLLIPIAVLAVLRRRRSVRPASGDRGGRGRVRYAGNAASQDGAQLGYLAAPPARAADAYGSHTASPRRGPAARNGGAGSLGDAPGRAAGFPPGAAAPGLAGHPDSSIFTMPALGPAKAGRREAPPGWDDPDGPAGFGGPAGFDRPAAFGRPGGPGGPGANGAAGRPARTADHDGADAEPYPASGQDAYSTPGGSGAGRGRDAYGTGGYGTADERDAYDAPGGSGAAGERDSYDAAGMPGHDDAPSQASGLGGYGSGAAGGLGPDGGSSDPDLDSLDPGPGGFSGSSSFTGLSPRAPAPPRASAAGHVPPGPNMTPLTRPPAGRQPRISGAPPWEPAAKPDTELPWATVPPPQPVNGPDPLPRRPVSRSAWDAASQGPGGHGPGGHSAGGHSAGGHSAGRHSTGDPRHGPGAADRTAGHSAPDRDADGTSGTGTGSVGPAPDSDPQIYLWNPGATTETFPTLPESGRSRNDG